MSTHAEKEIKPGDLCGWKYGGALILGHVTPDGVNGDKISMQPLSKPGKPGSVVTRRRETIILESELDKEDVEEAVEEGGHIAKSHIHSTSAQAHKMHIGPEDGGASREPKAPKKQDKEGSSASGGEETEKPPVKQKKSKKRSRAQQQPDAAGDDVEHAATPPKKQQRKGRKKQKGTG